MSADQGSSEASSDERPSEMPGVGVARVVLHDDGSRRPSVTLTFTVRAMWELITALDVAVAAAEGDEYEKIWWVRESLFQHQSHLLLVAEAEESPGPYVSSVEGDGWTRDDDLSPLPP